MKNSILLLLWLFLSKSLVAQSGFTPHQNINYFDQRNYWTEHFDSIVAYNEANGIDEKIEGFSSFLRWRDYWDRYMPSTGSYVDAYESIRLTAEHLKNVHYSTYQTGSGGGTTALFANPVEWTELGPMNMTKIKTSEPNDPNWYDTHVNNNGQNPPWDNNNATLKSGAHVAKIDRLYQHPTIPNKIYAIAGGIEHGGGGAFVSTDWGKTWNLLGKNNSGDIGTDQIPNPDIITFAVKPSDVAPNVGTEYLFVGLSTGAIYRSMDDGSTWIECNYFGNHPYPFNFYPLETGDYINDLSLPYVHINLNSSSSEIEKNREIKFAKSNAFSTEFSRLVVARHNGLFASNNFYASLSASGGNIANSITWNNLTDGVNDNFDVIQSLIPEYCSDPSLVDYKLYHFTDFESVDKNGSTLYFAHFQYAEIGEEGDGDNNVGTDTLSNIRHFVISSSDFGVTWSFVGGLNAPNAPHGDPITTKDKFPEANLEILDSNPTYLYVASTIVGATHSLRRYNLNTNVWEDLVTTNLDSPVGVKAHGFAIDPQNEEDWWFFTNDTHKMAGGQFTEPTYLYSTYHHADARDLLVLDNGTLLLGTDGGVYQSQKGPDDYIMNATSEGMNAAQSFNMELSQQPPFYVGSGFWHAGFQIYNPDTDEWHYGVLQDGKGGHFFFLNNERYSLGDQVFNVRIVKGFNELDDIYVGGPVASSENIDGRSYGTKRSGGNDILGYNNDDFTNSNGYTSLGISNTIYSSRPITIPNEPDLLVLKVSSKFLRFYDGCATTIPTPNLIKEVNAQVEYENLGGTAPVALGDIVFDHRRNGKYWMVLQRGTIYSSFKGGRIVEYEPSTDSYIDISYPIDDDYNSSTEFPNWLSISDMDMDRETGILYIATPIGVYYLDKSAQLWKKYSKNVPLLNASLGIRHCTGELFASCTNRGMWHTDLIRNEQVSTLTWEIDQHTTWNERINLFCTLVVKSGNTLYVNDELVVFGDQKIIVEPGARLVIQGDGLITSECGEFWSGIEVWGNNTATQTFANQGVVTLLNGGSIQNARNAIRVWKPGDWSSMGGIVQATNASFINNIRDVEFMPYSGISAGSNQGNLSYFKDCLFQTGYNYLGTTVAPHVSMYKVDGVRFTSCEFSDLRAVNRQFKNKGIHALDSKFKVLGTFIGSGPTQVDFYDETNFIPSKFTNLTHGVWAGNATSENAVMVDQSLFTDCNYGVTLSESNQGVISRNKFDRTANSNWFQVQYDIYTNRSTAYFIEGNEITKQGGDDVVGITNENSGTEDNKVYRNKLNTVENGVYGYGRNKNSGLGADARGLEFLCNTFNDISVHDELFNDIFVGDGVKIRQGLNSDPAGNVFSNISTVNYHLNNWGNSNTEYIYYQSSFVEEPTLLAGGVFKIGTQAENECKSHFDMISPRFGSVLNGVNISSLRVKYERYEDDLDDVLFDLSKATDSIIIDSLEQEAVGLYRDLSQISNIIIKDALLDSTAVDSNQFITWTNQRNDEYRFQKLVDFYWSRNNSTLVSQYLDSIGTASRNYPRGSAGEKEFLDYAAFKSALFVRADVNGNLQGLDSLTELLARDAALNKTGIAQVQGQNLLCFFLGECNEAPALPIAGARVGNESFEEEVLAMTESEKLSIYPNPSSSEIIVSLDTDALPVTIRIVDVNGKEVLKQITANNDHRVDISQLKNGAYFVLVIDNDGISHMKKLVKE